MEVILMLVKMAIWTVVITLLVAYVLAWCIGRIFNPDPNRPWWR